MCGILLYLNKRNGIDLRKFHEALNLQSSRGPDDQGVLYLDKLDSDAFQESKFDDKRDLRPQLVLGHRRLSIIDLTNSSRQPMVNPDRDFLIYNGEFYNYRNFASKETMHSDALTLFDLLKNKSVEGFRDVNGMWASVYGSMKAGVMFLSRDRYGKKPLYYYQSKDVLIVSSEMKSIFHLTGMKRKVEPTMLGGFLYGKMSPYPIDEKTFYKDIYSVAPGENLKFDLHTFELTHFSKTGFVQEQLPADPDKLEEMLVEDLNDSIMLRMISDAKLGVLVSGGVDSSLIAGVIAQTEMAKDVEFYTCHIVGADSKINDDLGYARLLAKHLDISLNEIRLRQLDKSSFLDLTAEMTLASEIPINYMLSSIPTYLISMEMRARGVGVAIDGVGGDEILGGYPSYQSMALAQVKTGNLLAGIQNYLFWLNQYSPKNKTAIRFFGAMLRTLIKNNDGERSNTELCRNLQSYFTSSDINNGIREYSEKLLKRNNYTTYAEKQLFEVTEYQLPYYLGTGDSFNMSSSIENRSPFLDKRLYKYIHMPEKFKRSFNFNKVLLRRAMPQNIPSEIRWRKGKLGIGTPYGEDYLFSQEAAEIVKSSNFVRSILSEDSIESSLIHNKHLFRGLYSLAVLDSQYSITI